MKYVIKYFLIFLFTGGLINKAYTQGCSDAGFCTAGNIKPSGKDQMRNSLGFSIGYGMGERRTNIYTPQFEPQIKVTDKSMIQLKIPLVYIKGDITRKSGLGDVILTYNYLFDSAWKSPITLTIGTRIATGTASLKKDNLPLPMPYQISLGTTDLILGVKIELKKGFSVSVGYQQPLFNRNQNGFDSAAFKSLMKEEQLNSEDNFFISSNLKRKGDILLRIDRTHILKHGALTVGLLPIYHLGNDKVSMGNEEVEIENSKGLTLNINMGFYHRWDNNLEFSTLFATPVIVRKSRPDGLTRAMVVVPGLRYYF